MEVVHTIDEIRKLVSEAKSSGKKVGFVPTMGFLHKGHLSLVEESKKSSEYQVMSIFVNKIQFNDLKDYNSYPKDLEKDFKLAREAGVDLMFVPDDGEMYRNNLTSVDVDLLTENLCGGHRPGHFKGVFTVVSKLFNIVQPDVSVFGQKDIQQAVSLEKMVLDLNFPLKIVIAPIIREDDGLAMSSRNKHLNPDERSRALAINKSMRKAEELLSSGERKAEIIIDEMKKVIEASDPDSIDYISVVKYNDLSKVDTIEEKSVIAVAVFYGTTRLIDNMIVDIAGGDLKCIYQ